MRPWFNRLNLKRNILGSIPNYYFFHFFIVLMNYYGHSHNWYRIKEPAIIGVNISERKSGIERTKKCKKTGVSTFPTARGRNWYCSTSSRR